MSRGNTRSKLVTYSDLRAIERTVTEHQAHIRQRYHLETRFIISRGIRPLDKRITAQAYVIVAEKASVLHEEYDVYPNVNSSCIQVCFLSLVMRLDTRLEQLAQAGLMPWLAPRADQGPSDV